MTGLGFELTKNGTTGYSGHISDDDSKVKLSYNKFEITPRVELIHVIWFSKHMVV